MKIADTGVASSLLPFAMGAEPGATFGNTLAGILGPSPVPPAPPVAGSGASVIALSTPLTAPFSPPGQTADLTAGLPGATPPEATLTPPGKPLLSGAQPVALTPVGLSPVGLSPVGTQATPAPLSTDGALASPQAVLAQKPQKAAPAVIAASTVPVANTPTPVDAMPTAPQKPLSLAAMAGGAAQVQAQAPQQPNSQAAAAAAASAQPANPAKPGPSKQRIDPADEIGTGDATDGKGDPGVAAQLIAMVAVPPAPPQGVQPQSTTGTQGQNGAASKTGPVAAGASATPAIGAETNPLGSGAHGATDKGASDGKPDDSAQKQAASFARALASNDAAAPARAPDTATAPSALPGQHMTTPAASAGAPAAAGTNVQPQQPVVQATPGQIGHDTGVAIARRAIEGGDELTVRLHPAELGRVEIKLSFEDGSLRATIRADAPAALDMLRRETTDLARALDQAGVRADAQSFRFEGGQGGNQPRHDGQPQPRYAGANASTNPDIPAAAVEKYRPLRTNGRIDLLA